MVQCLDAAEASARGALMSSEAVSPDPFVHLHAAWCLVESSAARPSAVKSFAPPAKLSGVSDLVEPL